MLGAVRGLLGSATGLAHARLALLGTELRAELVRSVLLLAGAGAAIGLSLLALAVAVAGVLLAVDAEHRFAAALMMALLLALCALLIAWRLYRALGARPALFADSLVQLQDDRQALLQRSEAARSALGESAGELMRLVSIGLVAYSIARRFTSKR